MTTAWDSFRLKHLARSVVEKADINDECPYVGLEAISSWTGEINLSASEESYESVGNRFQPGDILFGKLRPYLAKVAAPSFSGQCSGEALVLRPSSGIDARFLRYRLVEAGTIDAVNASTYGAKMPRASWDFIGNMRFTVPDLDTQKAIAAFLDSETARIDQLIEKKERLVEVLAEGLAASLEKATTPAHPVFEEMVPFRWVCRITEGQVDPTDPRWANKPLIAPNHIQSDTGRLLAIETAEEQGAISGKYAYPSGTVLYSKIRPALAKACIAPDAGMCSADMYPILPDKRLSPDFLLMQLLSRKFTDWATLESMRVAMPKINRETLSNYRLWVPVLNDQARLASEYSIEKDRIEGLSDVSGGSDPLIYDIPDA